MLKVDLHTHSQGSPDGGLTPADYRQIVEQGLLDVVAVTDHNSIAFAQELQQQLGDNVVIVGEEVTAREGELIGLFLREAVPAGLSVADTAAKIHKQGGLVYVPHPFETVRKGLPLDVLEGITDQVDIVETHNGRAVFQNKDAQAAAWASGHNKAMAASSDAHGRHGWGKTYSELTEQPSRDSIVRLLAAANYQKGFVGMHGILYPKLNRFKKRMGKHA